VAQPGGIMLGETGYEYSCLIRPYIAPLVLCVRRTATIVVEVFVIDVKKRFLRFLKILVTFFTFLTFFYFPNVLYF